MKLSNFVVDEQRMRTGGYVTNREKNTTQMDQNNRDRARHLSVN